MLDEQIKEAAAKGMTHLALYPTPSADGKKIYWRATATPSTGHKYVTTTSLDPVEALSEVLKALPKAPKRAPAEKLTVAVIENYKPDDIADETQMPSFKPSGLHPELEQEIDQWLPKL